EVFNLKSKNTSDSVIIIKGYVAGYYRRKVGLLKSYNILSVKVEPQAFNCPLSLRASFTLLAERLVDKAYYPGSINTEYFPLMSLSYLRTSDL
ncbi:MAG TPA: hypothetical protein VFH09_01980, partial [Nitrososphaera sp.]|nr:hypothetical protein [Nitrososphaera sp.]